MKITDIQVGRICLPLRHPFKTALRTVEAVDDVAVRLLTDDGAVGYGLPPPSSPGTPPAPSCAPSGTISARP